MKILLINPPRVVFPGFSAGLEKMGIAFSLGLMYIAAVLEREGHPVEILDCRVADVPPQREGGALFVGMPWRDIGAEIARRQPDIVGITNWASNQIEATVRVARIAKENNGRVLTVVGGTHPTAAPLELLSEEPSVDVVVVGEGENTMLDIVNRWQAGQAITDIPGTAHRRNGEVVLNPARPFITDLDELPYPAYHLMDMEKYLSPHTLKYLRPRPFWGRSARSPRALAMVTSRGCPFNCVFCAAHLAVGKRWRPHSRDFILSHIEYVVSKFGVEHIYFVDDNLTLNMDRFDGILDGLMERGIRITWEPGNGVRADRLNLVLLEKMKKTGCSSIEVGVESGVQRVLDRIIQKQLHLEDVIRLAQMCQQVGIRLGAFYVIGFPGETKQDMKKTVEFAINLKRRYGVDINMFIATPFKGTPLYHQCREMGYLVEKPIPSLLPGAATPWGKCLIKTKEFDPAFVERLASRAMTANAWLSFVGYLKRPRQMMHALRYLPRYGLTKLFRGLRRVRT